MAKRKPKRVHVECATARGFRELSMLMIAGRNPDGSPVYGTGVGTKNPDGSITPGPRFHDALDATGCRVIQTLDGARRRRR